MVNASARQEEIVENLIPPLLQAVRHVRRLIGSGRSMREAFRSYLENTSHNQLSAALREHWIHLQQGRQTTCNLKTHWQRAFWELVERGAAGQPCLEALHALEDEIEKAAQAELDRHLAALPFKVLLPLLLFQFPAFMIVLLGPMLRELNRSFGA